MKKVTVILFMLLCVMGYRCSKETYLTPGDNVPTAASSANIPSPLKQKSYGNAKYEIPGHLDWHDELNAYQADFGNAGILTITGSHPYTSPPTPVFEVVSSSVPTSSVTSSGMDFTVTWSVLPTDPQIIVVKEVDDVLVGGDTTHFVEEIMINTPPGTPYLLTLSGHIVLIGSDYYAVATEYQVPGQSPVTITVPPGGHKVTFVNTLNSTYYNGSFLYKRNTDVWRSPAGSTMDLIAGSSYQFQVTLSNKSGYAVPANFSLNVDGAIQSTGGKLLPTYPAYDTFPNTTLKGGGVDFTVTVSASAPYVAINLINATSGGATLTNPQYSMNGGTLLPFTPTIYVPQNTSIKYQGTITCPPGEEQNVQLITPGATLTYTHQTAAKFLLTPNGYNGGSSGYSVTFSSALL